MATKVKLDYFHHKIVSPLSTDGPDTPTCMHNKKSMAKICSVQAHFQALKQSLLCLLGNLLPKVARTSSESVAQVKAKLCQI